jgi:hypothetical protein
LKVGNGEIDSKYDAERSEGEGGGVVEMKCFYSKIKSIK